MKTSLLAALALFITMANSQALVAADAEHGRTLYRTYCAQCHGLEGDGFGVNSLYMEVAPKDHTETAEMQTRSDADLFKAIKDGGKAVDKSALMPNWDANLSNDEILALVAYLRILSKTGSK
jgi:cytochrome c oxidase cbb3-type subunit 3